MNTAKVRDVVRELERLTRVAESLQNKHVAHFSLHLAACLDGDRDAVLEHRQALHVLLDRLLDNGERVQFLQGELVKLTREL